MFRTSSICAHLACLVSLAGLASPACAIDLTITGTCPGTITMTISGGPANETVPVLEARSTGSFVIPGGYLCTGTRLGLSSEGLRVRVVFQTDDFGYASFTTRSPGLVCGKYYQAITAHGTCSTSNVARMPVR